MCRSASAAGAAPMRSACSPLLVIAAVIVALVLKHAHNRPGGRHGGGGSTLGPGSRCPRLRVQPLQPLGRHISQNNDQAKYAVDGSVTTAWTTEQYYGGNLDEQARRRDLRSGSGAVAARKMVVDTTTAGFNAMIYATQRDAEPEQLHGEQLGPVGGADDVASTQPFQLNTGGNSYRYYLFWITSLPSNGNYISVNEIKLYR